MPDGKRVATAQDLDVFGMDLFGGIKLSVDYGDFAAQEGLLPIATEKAARDGTPRLEVEDKDGILWVRTYGMGGADIVGSAVIRAGLGLIASAYPSFVMLDAHINRKGDEYESN